MCIKLARLRNSESRGRVMGGVSFDWPSAMSFALAMREKNEGSVCFPVCLLPEPILNLHYGYGSVRLSHLS